jgi:hypothetical protein
MVANEKQVTFLHSRMHTEFTTVLYINPLNAELKPICHLLALLGAHRIFHVSRIRVKQTLSHNCTVIVQFRLGSPPTRVHSQKPTIIGVRG